VQLDPLREVIMWRLQYRNFGRHQTLVGNFVTDVDGTDHGGIRWFELRRERGAHTSWRLFQEGTFAPDGDNRWMGSIAMETFGEGNVISGQLAQTATTRWGDYSSMNVDPRDDCTFWYPNEVVTSPAFGGAWGTRIASFRFPGCGDDEEDDRIAEAAPSN
jgi:hypothetical protein